MPFWNPPSSLLPPEGAPIESPTYSYISSRTCSRLDDKPTGVSACLLTPPTSQPVEISFRPHGWLGTASPTHQCFCSSHIQASQPIGPMASPKAAAAPPSQLCACSPHRRQLWSTWLWWPDGIALGPTRCLLHKSISARVGDVDNLPNM